MGGLPAKIDQSLVFPLCWFRWFKHKFAFGISLSAVFKVFSNWKVSLPLEISFITLPQAILCFRVTPRQAAPNPWEQGLQPAEQKYQHSNFQNFARQKFGFDPSNCMELGRRQTVGPIN